MNEKLFANDKSDASITRAATHEEQAHASGIYEIECFDKDGNLKWKDTIKNVVTTVGKNAALDAFLAGSNYTVTGPYMGLISSDSWSAVNVADAMNSHGGWREAGNAYLPTYSGTRKTCAWNLAGSGQKALSAALGFAMTAGGTVKGCFIVFGTGATNAIDNTSGVLYSCGTFSGGDKTVINGDTINVSWTGSL